MAPLPTSGPASARTPAAPTTPHFHTVLGDGHGSYQPPLHPPRTPTSATSVAPTPTSGRRPRRRADRGDAEEMELEDIRRYESFSTVDWIVDSTRERARVARAKAREQLVGPPSSNAHLATGASLSSSSSSPSPWGHFGYAPGERPPRWWPTTSPWGRRAWWVTRLALRGASAGMDSGVVVLVGVLIGVNMAIISIATEWASDLKQGYCKAGWWLNQKFCCWELMDAAGPGGAVVPPASIKAGLAAAAAAAAAAASSPGTSNITTRTLHDVFPALYPRAAAADASTSDVAAFETCTDWVPWSTWTVPAYILYIFFAALLAAACAHLVRAFAPYAAGSGITEIKCILAGFIINGFLGFQTLVIKSLSLPLAIASGLSVGKEGPAVHVACCIGNVVSSFFRSFDRSQARMRELLTAASAAGVAVAFGSPIGGVLFSLEEMAYQFPATTMWRSFLCALAATVTLSFMNPFRTGKLVLFQVAYDRDWHYFEMVFYVVIGVFGGLYGAFVIKYNLQVQAFRRTNLAAYGVSEAVVLATLTAFIGYWNKFLRIDMTESLEILFRECEGGGDYDNLCQSWAQWRMVNSLLLATVLRCVLVVLSYGCKVPAGIFVPSMAIGATFGRMLGILVKAMHTAFPHAALFSACQPEVPCITPGTYAFLGAAAALAGVTRITVAVVVIMFELTGALTYILPTMIVVMVTKGVGDLYGKGGIAEQTMKFAGYPFLDKDEHNFGLLPVREVMKRDPDVVYARGMCLREVEQRLGNTYRGFPVVRSQEDRTLLGYVGKTEVRYAITKARRARPTLSAEATQCVFTCADDEDDDGDDEGRAARGVPTLPQSWPPSATVTATTATMPRGTHGRGRGRGRGRERDEEEEDLMGSMELGGSGARNGDDADHDDDDDDDDDADHDPTADSAATSSSEGDPLDLGAWVDQTPLSVPPSMPLEVVMDLFKKMGPRVILVTGRQGTLLGLVTVKDLLKHIASQEHADAQARKAAREAREDGGGGGGGGGGGVFGATLPEWVLPSERGVGGGGGGLGVGATGTRRPSAGTAGAAGAVVEGALGSFDAGLASLNNFGGGLEAVLSNAWGWARSAALRARGRGPRGSRLHGSGSEYAELQTRAGSESLASSPGGAGSGSPRGSVLYDRDRDREDAGGEDAGGEDADVDVDKRRRSTQAARRGEEEGEHFVIE